MEYTNTLALEREKRNWITYRELSLYIFAYIIHSKLHLNVGESVCLHHLENLLMIGDQCRQILTGPLSYSALLGHFYCLKTVHFLYPESNLYPVPLSLPASMNLLQSVFDNLALILASSGLTRSEGFPRIPLCESVWVLSSFCVMFVAVAELSPSPLLVIFSIITN